MTPCQGRAYPNNPPFFLFLYSLIHITITDLNMVFPKATLTLITVRIADLRRTTVARLG